MPLSTPLRTGTDIGGTFTDVAVVDERGDLKIGKQLTTHGAEEEGVIAAVGETGVDLSDPAVVFAHGTTLVINSLIERKGCRAALVTTKGFGDVLDIGRANRAEIFNIRYERHSPLIGSEFRFEVDERVLADGEISKAPDAEEIRQVAARIRAAGAEAVAVCLVNSYAQPANERRVGELLAEELPDLTVTLSSDLSREWREYERFTTASANAYVAPVTHRYIEKLENGLKSKDFRGDFIILDSNGGAVDPARARKFPIRSVESGPVAGVIGARAVAAALGEDSVVTFDMGGTTAKCCVVEEGRFASTDLYWIGGYRRGLPLQIAVVDVLEVGAGGGSLGWVDEAGRLRVGPVSAGSIPGPACYGLGGTQASVTDANLFCGRIDKDNFVSSLRLHPEAAEKAVVALAKHAGLRPRRLALGLIKLANMSMAAAVRRQTLERGLDPRKFLMVAYGGAGPMHACEVAAECGIERVLIPPFPGHFSAIGMLSVNRRIDRREVTAFRLSAVSESQLQNVADRIRRELTEDFEPESSRAALRFEYALLLRYHGQDHTLRIELTEGEIEHGFAEGIETTIRARFEREYLRRYSHLDTNASIEVVEMDVVAELRLPEVPILDSQTQGGEPSKTEAYFGTDEKPVVAQVLSRGSLRAGDTLEGATVVYEQGATTVIPPGATCSVLNDASLLVDVTDVHV